jgi:hypothetical protein
VPQDDDRLGARNLARIFKAANNIRVDDGAGHARAEHISNTLIENQFGGHARIDAADNGGVGRLATGGLFHLRHEIAIDGLARRKPLVAGFELWASLMCFDSGG